MIRYRSYVSVAKDPNPAATPLSFRFARSACIGGSVHSPRCSARSPARVIGTDRIEQVGIAKNEVIVNASYAK